MVKKRKQALIFTTAPCESGAEPWLRAAPRSLAHDIATLLTGQISQGVFSVGAKLPSEAQLGRTHEVSRTVIREALSHLQASGLVETRHGSGTFVLSPVGHGGGGLPPHALGTINDILAMLELRISLETEGAGLAALRRTDDDLAAMRRSLDLFERHIARGDNAVSVDVEFHLQIARATRNPYFEEIYRYMGRGTIPRNRINTAELARELQGPYLRRTNFEHEDILQAITRKDVDAARATMRIHLVNSRERLRLASENPPLATAEGHSA